MTGFPNAFAWRAACAADAVLATWAGPWAVCFAIKSGSDATIFSIRGDELVFMQDAHIARRVIEVGKWLALGRSLPAPAASPIRSTAELKS